MGENQATLGCGRMATMRESEVPSQLGRQNRAVEDLHGALNDLFDRLDPALRPIEPTPEKGMGMLKAMSAEMQTQIGQRLDSSNDSIERAAIRIREAIDRLEI